MFQILIYFFVKIAPPPPEKSYPPLSQQHPSKSCGPVKHPTLFLNIFGGAHYEHMHDFYKWIFFEKKKHCRK